MTSEQNKEPRIGIDAATIRAMLHELGVQEYEPRVVSQLLDLAYATTSDMLLNARAISLHCGKTAIDEMDVQHALNITGLLREPGLDRMSKLHMAHDKNSQPLPPIRHNFGLKLPQDRFCLLQQNYEWRGEEQQQRVSVLSAVKAESVPVVQPQHVQANIFKKQRLDDDFDS